MLLLTWILDRGNPHLALLLPGIIALPVYAMLPCARGHAVPLSLPGEQAKSAGRGLSMIGVMVVSSLLALLAAYSYNQGFFGRLLLIEAVAGVGLYLTMRASAHSAQWESLE
jgi:hypothetical protein